MIAILKKGAGEKETEELCLSLRREGLDVRVFRSEDGAFLTVSGENTNLLEDALNSVEIIESVSRVSEPYKKAGRSAHPDDTVIEIGGKVRIGGGNFSVIAGPCSVESEKQILSIARQVKEFGADILRGGAFKPRTSPYDFQGLHEEGIKLLLEAKREIGIPVVSEIMDINHLPLFEDVDIIQVGARNMQNYELLKELGKTGKPILLKRGLSSTLRELLMSAEYIMSGGNDKVILCERGIRTFEVSTRNTLDLSAVPLLHEMTHLPVIVDPSHGTGLSRLVTPMSLSSAACGADGVMIEVHDDPLSALCDGRQAITPDEFGRLQKKLNALRRALSEE